MGGRLCVLRELFQLRAAVCFYRVDKARDEVAKIFLHNGSVQEGRHAKPECFYDQGQVVISMVNEEDCGECVLLIVRQKLKGLQTSQAGHFEADYEERWRRIVRAGRFNESESILAV